MLPFLFMLAVLLTSLLIPSLALPTIFQPSFLMSNKAPTFQLLSETNYHEWAFFMEAVLIQRDLLGVVDGTVTCPLGSSNSKPVKAFLHKQKVAHTEIVFHVSPSQLPHVCDPDPIVIGTCSMLFISPKVLSPTFCSCER